MDADNIEMISSSHPFYHSPAAHRLHLPCPNLRWCLRTGAIALSGGWGMVCAVV